jgi:ribosome assembly protein RRB1
LTPENTGDGLDQQLPTQLLFIHQGQQQIKEAHFHPQVPGLICSTAVDSFCIFKPNITPQEGE